MRSMMKRFALPMVSAALLASPAAAQTQGETPMQGQGEMAADFSAEKLKSFAEAVEGIQQVARDYAPRLRDADNRQQVADLEQQAQDEMLQTVQDEGLTVEEYNQIAVAAQTDPQLAQEIQGYMTEGAGATGGGQSD
ncbi:DUF4168 domain-containing protein [Caenispirillum salinarum]|uniref:DUF4168 domain-containing protein n=1 Tax=Caenispirillum salinarum TaxID=859058 RepID=UPI00384B5044